MAELRPISFAIDAANRLRRATYRGVITDDVLFHTYQQLISEPGYDPTLNDMVDLRAVERLDLSAEAIHALVAMFSGQDGQATNRLAIVAPTDLGFGLGRMYEMLSEGTGEHIRVFRDLSEAEQWLNLK